MATLQQTFKYEGNVSSAPLKTVNLEFEIPSFEFVTVLLDGKPFIDRNDTGEQRLNIFKNLPETKYSLPVSGVWFAGTSDSSNINFWKHLTHIGFSNTDSGILDLLSFQYNILINDEPGNIFGHHLMDVLFSLATSSDKYKKILDHQKAISTGVSYNEAEVQKLDKEISDYVKENIFLINKTAFKEVAVQFKSIIPNFNDYALLFIIAHLTDVSSDSSVFKAEVEEFKQFMKNHFQVEKPEAVNAVIKLIKENFNRLFDFPITVPEIRSVAIKGTFKIVTSDNSAIALSDLNFYQLSTEYSIQLPGGNGQACCIVYDWSSVTPDQLIDNTVSFSFPVIITNLLNSLIQIRVKGFEGNAVWENEYTPENTELQKLKIEVPLNKPSGISISEDNPGSGNENKKLYGKVIKMNGECPVNGLTVVIQAKTSNDTIWKIVGAATTDASGNFSLLYPYGNYTAAQALVSLTPDSPADITIYNDAAHIASNKTISDDFIFLMLKDLNCEPKKTEDDCECKEPKKSNRLPDQEELISSDSYTQDIGGSCINLSTPNRTLNEYSYTAIVRTSDPDVANYVLTKDRKGNFRLTGGEVKKIRKPVDLSNPILWQDAPDDHNNLSLYQAVTVATGHILHYKLVTKADGYSMGELLYSLPLAPGQKKEIVMYEQTHSLTGSESQQISQRESLAASLVNDVDITDTIAGNIGEATRGNSSATTGGVSGGFGLGAILDGVGISLGVAGGVANANSSASQNSSRALSEFFHEKMRNAITQNAQSYREMNATVVTTVQESQRYGVTSEVVANHNHCHSLTMMYFEVLRHYAMYQELSYVEECLFIPLLLTDFTKENIYKWRDVLAANLLPMPSETYLQPFTIIKSGRQHPLLRAFDAIERIKTDYANVDFPPGAYDDEIINFITGEMYVQTNLPRPKTKYDRIKSWPLEKKSTWSWSGALIGGVLAGPIGFVAGGYMAGDGSIKPEVQSVIDDYMSVDANFATVSPANCIRIKKIDKFIFEDGGFDKAQWMAYGKLFGKNNEDDVAAWMSYYFKDRLISEWDSIFYNDIAPALFERIVLNISIGGFSAIDFATERKYKGGEALMKLNLRGNGSNKKRNQITALNIMFNNYAGLSNDLITLNIKNLTIRYSTSHYNGILYSGFVNNDLYDNVENIATPENANEKRNPKKEDQYMADKLIVHLNSNLEYYNKLLWRNLDVDRRFMLLDGFKIETYDEFGQPSFPSGFRSLASVVKNELIGISGNSMIMPVAPGYKVDRTYVIVPVIEGPEQKLDLFEHYKPLTPIPPYRISIPTKGVFAEAVQGACDACEKEKENTSQDWDKFKTDEPTAINPVTVPVPTITDWKAAFKDFATPIVNIQNAPAAPAPGAGLAASGIADLLGKSDIFKDVTGLDQNQKNAMQTYLSNQENAKAFAEMAKEMAMQGHNTEHSDKIQDSINNAKSSGAITDEQAKQLTKDHLQQMIDGGQTKKAEQEAAAQSGKPSLTDVAARAEEKGKPVKASSTDPSGKAETLEVGAGKPKDFRVEGNVPLVLQGEKTKACWAAAATMMKSWKDGKHYTITDVLAMVPGIYLTKYQNNLSLLSAEKIEFIEALGMVGEPPASYTFSTYIGWLKTYGPLWVTVDSNTTAGFSPHAKVLIGYNGDGTEQNSKFVFLDPAVNGEQSETFAKFLEEYEQMVTDNPGDLFIQIVHFKNAIAIGEGGSSPTVDLKTKNSPFLRTFNPDIFDKSGQIEIEALTSNVPADSLIEWSCSVPAGVTIVNPEKKKTKILAGKPGIYKLFCKILSSDRSTIIVESSIDIGVPQFFVISDTDLLTYTGDDGGLGLTNSHKFDTVLNQLNLANERLEIIDNIKEMTEFDILHNEGMAPVGHNIRTVWQIGNHSETIPTSLVNPDSLASPDSLWDNYYSNVKFQGYRPSTIGQMFAQTTPRNPPPFNGPEAPNELILIYPGQFELITHKAVDTSNCAGIIDLQTKFTKIVKTYLADPNNSDLKSMVIEVFCRLVANTICHEIYHSIMFVHHDLSTPNGDVVESDLDINGHTLDNSAFGKDIMWTCRNLKDRTAFDIVDMNTFPAEGSYTIHPYDVILKLNRKNDERCNINFPVPPVAPFNI